METVKINVATVGTQQAAQQTKTLKQQIKELRNELATLDTTTDEYNQKVQQLGNLMHQQTEITNQAKLATDDYGRTLSNLTTVANGVVGSFAAVQGVMNSLGLANTDAEEAIKTMTSLMGIMQGLSNLDQASKAFKGLMTRINNTTTATKANTVAMQNNSTAVKGDAASLATATTATKAQGVAAVTTTRATNLLTLGFRKLGVAIKSFMVSNPFTLILLAVTAISTAISGWVSKLKDAKEEAAKTALEMKYASINAMTVYGTGESDEQKRRRGRNYGALTLNGVMPTEESKKELEKLEDNLSKLQTRMKNGKDYSGFLRIMKDLGIAEGDLNAVEEKLYETRTKLNTVSLHLANNRKKDLESRKGELELYKKLNKEQQAELDIISEKLDTVEKNIAEYENALADLDDAGSAVRKKIEDDQKKANDEYVQKMKAKFEEGRKIITEQYSLEKILLSRQLRDNEITQEQYYNKLSLIEDKYLDSYKNLVNKYTKYVKLEAVTVAEQEDKVTDALRKSIQERLKIEERLNNPTNSINKRNADQSVKDALANYMTKGMDNERLLAETQEYTQKAQEIYNAWWLEKYALIDGYNRKEVEAERQKNEELLLIEKERQQASIDALYQQYATNRGDENRLYQYQKDVLEKQHNAKLLLDDEYNQKVEELDAQHYNKLRELEEQYVKDHTEAEMNMVDIEREIQENRYLMEKEFFERRMELEKNYINAFSMINSSISSLLSEIQGTYKEGTKEYEQIAEAMIIMQTIEGSLAAFMSGVEAPIPAPYNFALGGVLAALATATGIASLRNLKSKNISSTATNAAISVNPYETLAYRTNTDILGAISDQRCYVTEQDITSTQTRVRVTETEASF